MLNDIKPPPLEPRDLNHPHAAATPDHGHATGRNGVVDVETAAPRRGGRLAELHVDTKEPGRHHSRYLGDIPTTDVVYAMPMEDRGSNFSITLSIVTIALFSLVVLSVWWMLA
jgi:hypothetical protein